MFQKLKENKKFLFLVGSIILIFFLISFLYYLYYLSQIGKISEIKEEIIPEKSEEELMIERQLKELEQLRGEAQPPTPEEIKRQIEELEKLRKEIKPPSPEEIERQIEELDKLRELEKLKR